MGQFISGFKDHSLLLLLLLGTVFNCIWLMRFKDRLRLQLVPAIIASAAHTVYGVFCVTVFAVLEVADVSSAGNMSLFGGVFFMPVGYFVVAKLFKRKMTDVFDICTICMMFTLMCARTNCIISGCCRGIRFFGMDGVRWPTRELEIIFYIIMIVVLGKKVQNGTANGKIYPIYMISYGAFRFIIEGLRAYSGTSVIHRGHIWAVITLGLGLSIYIELQNKKKKR